LVIISLVHATTYAWFWSDGSHNNLRPRPHPFELPDSDSQNFLSRLINQDIY